MNLVAKITINEINWVTDENGNVLRKLCMSIVQQFSSGRRVGCAKYEVVTVMGSNWRHQPARACTRFAFRKGLHKFKRNFFYYVWVKKGFLQIWIFIYQQLISNFFPESRYCCPKIFMIQIFARLLHLPSFASLAVSCPCLTKTREVLGNPSPTRGSREILQAEGMVLPLTVFMEYRHSLIINLSQGVDQQILPCGLTLGLKVLDTIRFFLMMREWHIF